MVGGALLAARRRELVLPGQPGSGGGDGVPARELAQAAVQVQRRRVDRVVGARVADEPVEVQRLGGAHGPRRSHARAGGGAHQRRRVERRRRLVLTWLGLVRGDLGGIHLGAGVGRLHRLLRVEAPLGVRDLERVAVVLERGLELPVRDGHERTALELAIDDQAQGGRLHAPHGQVVGAVAVGRQRHEAREHRAPDEVDILPRVRRLGEVEVDGRGLVERGLDLLRRERGVADADVPVDDGRRQHGLDVRIAAVDRLRRRRLGARLGAVLGRGGLALLLLRLVARIVLERVAAQDLDGLVADELALAVVVGGDDELGGALGDGAQRRERAGGAAVDHPREIRLLDHVAEVLETPALVGVGEHGLHDVAAQADGDGVVAVHGEVVRPHLLAAAAVLLDGDLAAEDLGDLLGRRILLCDDELHCYLMGT